MSGPKQESRLEKLSGRQLHFLFSKPLITVQISHTITMTSRTSKIGCFTMRKQSTSISGQGRGPVDYYLLSCPLRLSGLLSP
jgi:hypothetical protein